MKTVFGALFSVFLVMSCSSENSDSPGNNGGSGNRGGRGGSAGTSSGTSGSGGTTAACGAGQTSCSGVCTNLNEDGANCGACGTNCAASGKVCSQGQCAADCAEGLELCDASCVDLQTSELHCGTCNTSCGTGTCDAGSCTCPAGQTKCSDGTCKQTCTDNPDTGTELKCNDPVYGNVTVKASAVISDFSTGEPLIIAQEGRGEGADPWHAYAWGDTNDANGEMQTPGASNPKHASNAFAVDSAVSGPCNAGGALHVKSPGNEGTQAGIGAAWGVGFGIDFMARTSARKKQAYDASAYSGIGFWAKCSKDVEFSYMKAVDAAQDADVVNATCAYSGSTICNQHGVKNAVMTKDWTYYKLYFDELLQDPKSQYNVTKKVDKSKLTAFQIHVNLKSNRSGTLSKNDFDCYIDDVHFLEDAPAKPSGTVTFTTSGNKILRNGTEYLIRGMTRPSMEWDPSGFGVTREDVQRMKAWGINTVRLPVDDGRWLGEGGSTNASEKAMYQANVKRAVNWILEQDLDVILDLHHVAGVPTTHCEAFWTDIVTNSGFANNGRIIFELYNEPNGDWAAIKSGMQRLYDIVRAKANNLVLIGGNDWSFLLNYYDTNKITNAQNVAYVSHPYAFKVVGMTGGGTTVSDSNEFVTFAAKYPVVATEFGDANVGGHTVPATQCEARIYQTLLAKFKEKNISWTGWAWIVDEWGCGFPQLIQDYSGTPNSIGTPVRNALLNP